MTVPAKEIVNPRMKVLAMDRLNAGAKARQRTSPATSDRFARGHCGFSLIELLIVLVVFLVIAAIAIPNLMKARLRANESSAVASLHAISSGEVVYATIYGIGFSDNLAKLSGNAVIPDQNSAGLIDTVLASGTKSGYSFAFTVLATDSVGHVQSYCVTADPVMPNSSGTRYFYMDQTSVIRFSTSGTAGPSDMPIG